jgi:hypothetical protein
MDLGLLFFAQPEADGSTSLRVSLESWAIKTSGIHVNPFHPGDFLGQIDPRTAHPDVVTVGHNLYRVFGANRILGQERPKLINLQIPGAIPVLSFKVLTDGGLGVYLPPSGFGPLAQLAVQRELTDLTK